MMDLIVTYYCILCGQEHPMLFLSYLTALITVYFLVTNRICISLSGKYLLGEIFRMPASPVSIQCVTPAGIRPEICP